MMNRKLFSGAFALACCSSALLSASAAQAANFCRVRVGVDQRIRQFLAKPAET